MFWSIGDETYGDGECKRVEGEDVGRRRGESAVEVESVGVGAGVGEAEAERMYEGECEVMCVCVCVCVYWCL